jgi:lipoprotein-anchoring transpeptidase ErfK/SrfK
MSNNAMTNSKKISRKEFLQLGGLGLSATALRPLNKFTLAEDFPVSERLGRVADPVVTLRSRPTTDAPVVGELREDTIVPWLREVVGYTPFRSQRWIETDQGYVWSPLLQPVENRPNAAIDSLLDTSQGPGMWMEVTVPYVNVSLVNANPISPRVTFLTESGLPIRLYYGQIIWVDDIRTGDQGVEYHVKELHGSYGDHFWGPAEAFRPIQPDELAPISPEVEEKSILIDLNRQTLSCFEGNREAYFCRVSSGRFGAETPVGEYLRIFWKLVSVHMSGGTAGAGYDLTGVAWPTFFATNGIAIHGTFWHNNYGEKTSAGCVNVLPEDAKFISLWSSPSVPYDPGVVDVGGTNLGTSVRVIES